MHALHEEAVVGFEALVGGTFLWIEQELYDFGLGWMKKYAG